MSELQPHQESYCPDASNCFGHIWSAEIGLVCERAMSNGPWKVIRCDQSGRDRHWNLHLEAEGLLDLECETPMRDGSYLISGAIEIGTGRGESLLSTLSQRMAQLGIPHSFELYDDRITPHNLIHRYHHLWPDESASKPNANLWNG